MIIFDFNHLLGFQLTALALSAILDAQVNKHFELLDEKALSHTACEDAHATLRAAIYFTAERYSQNTHQASKYPTQSAVIIGLDVEFHKEPSVVTELGDGILRTRETLGVPIKRWDQLFHVRVSF